MKVIKLRYRGHDGIVYEAWFLRVPGYAFRLTQDKSVIST